MNVLLVGASGYLGKYILSELVDSNINTTVIVRKPIELSIHESKSIKTITAKITDPKTIINCCDNIDIVISTVGITKQKDGLTYMDVDYQANVNLLNEAIKCGVKKFIYISALNGDKLKHLKIFEAKEKFVDELKISGLEYCVIRPNGFFSDLTEFYNMAKKGRVYLFGDGELKSNPIHGEDLAKYCISAIERDEKELSIGGPNTLTQNEIANIAFNSLGSEVKISYIPIWISKTISMLLKLFTTVKFYGPIEFFLTVLTIEMRAPEYGKKTLANYYKELSSKLDKI